MNSHVLKFDSPEKSLGIIAPSKPYDDKFGGRRVFESLTPHVCADLRSKGLGLYKVSIEREVSTEDEVAQGLQDALKFSVEFDIAWCYAWGQPYSSAKLALEVIEAPGPARIAT